MKYDFTHNTQKSFTGKHRTTIVTQLNNYNISLVKIQSPEVYDKSRFIRRYSNVLEWVNVSIPADHISLMLLPSTRKSIQLRKYNKLMEYQGAEKKMSNTGSFVLFLSVIVGTVSVKFIPLYHQKMLISRNE